MVRGGSSELWWWLFQETMAKMGVVNSRTSSSCVDGVGDGVGGGDGGDGGGSGGGGIVVVLVVVVVMVVVVMVVVAPKRIGGNVRGCRVDR